ncbi:MAG: sigma-54 dependent transcriptional regulator [Nitrospira sp.]|nr:sigma-54 dependent transcriptional regulator [Nitrospira sp.]MDE0404066.1 sigma-54 dependent transcriptional regulator [Nitrospira sp.]MDE0487525.1 sigma-54 dependent transcriptional regulator [Nitrospira sp.]
MNTTTILLVEDNPSDARLVQELFGGLQGRSFNVLIAESLQRAHEHLKELRVDVALIDLSLPDSHGLDTFRKFAAEYPAIPQILLTGLDDRDVAIQAVREGAQDYLLKGEVEEHILIQAIDYAIERKRIQVELEAANTRLQKTAEDLHYILNQLHIGTILINPEGRILYMSVSALRLLGKNESIPEGRPWQDVVGFDDHDVQILERLMEQDEREKCVVYFTLPDHSQRQLEIDIHDDPRDTRAKMFFLYDVTEIHTLRKQLESEFHNLIGKCQLMQDVYRQIRNLAQVDSTVIIEGETGTGKELVARALHNSSPRKDKTFLAVNCAGLAESLLSSQLFGHKKGAFTGANSDHRGFFEAAQGGTIFLDEIGDMTAPVQTSLLRVLQEKEITRLGESRPRKVDVRIICATHHDLQQQVDQRTFRADLLYRIRIGRIHLPPLRERQEDIPLLIWAFVGQCRKTMGKPFVQDVSADAWQRLTRYHWPGNIRELKSVIEYAVLQCEGDTIQARHFPPELLESALHVSETTTPVKDRERLLGALKKANGNRARAAQFLGISRATFYRWLGDLNISKHDLS